MNRYLKLIWFFEDDWTKYHAAVGINADKTLCGVIRSTRPILPSERLSSNMRTKKCFKCLAVLRRKYGYEFVKTVNIES